MSQYKILGKLGSGGMGVVYQALDTRLHRTVAIKVFHENLVQEEIVIKRFLRESIISAQLDHPHIVKVYNFEKQGDQSFLVMECIQGKPLLEYIEEQQPSLEIKLEILAKTARALHHAHRKQILHRDIKPANIMVRTNGEPVLMDFGLAKCVGLEDLTRTGDLVGTPHYMSPEQAEGKRREIDHRTDIYSLGAVMYHLFVGQVPFVASSFHEMLEKLQYEKPIPPRQLHPELPLAVEQICLKALSKDKEQRYASAQEFADDIQNHLAGKKTKAVSWSKKQTIRRWLLRSGLVIGALLLLLGLAWCGYFYAQHRKIAEKQDLLNQKIQLLQSQIENQKLWRIDQLDLWQQAYQTAQEAWDLYQQNRQWVGNDELAIRLANDRAQCAYKLGIHRWIDDPLQSINSFSSALDIPLPKQQQDRKTELSAIAADMHLKYLSRNYNEVCEILPIFIKCSTPNFKISSELFAAYPEVIFLVAKSHYHCQRYTDAQKYLQILTNHVNFMAHTKINAEVLYYQAMCYYHKKQYQEALINFQHADQAWNKYQKPVDFGVSLLIHWGDCQSQLIPYSDRLSAEQRSQFELILQRLEKVVDTLPSRSIELALYYELYARTLLSPLDDKDPQPEQITRALAMTAKSMKIVPCRYTQHLLQGIAFQYQGRTNFNHYHKAWQEFSYASQLNQNQADSAVLLLNLNTQYLNYSRDQVSDLIMQIHRWNTHMESVATDFYGSKMRQLEWKCNGQLQKFVGIPYEERLVVKFYNDLQSPISSIRTLAKLSLIDLVSYQDGMATHYQTYAYLEQKCKHIDNHDPLRPTLLAILQEIDAQAWQESAWQHLYLLVRIPYRDRIPLILLKECNARPGMVTFLMQMLQDHQCKMMPELKSYWPWLQYLAARVLVQLPYPLDTKTLSLVDGSIPKKYVYARQMLYEMITTPAQNKSLSPIFCLSVAKAFQDARFIWWNRSLIFNWFHAVWPQLKANRDPEDMWYQTNLTSLLISHTDEPSRNLLATVYKETRYDIVKAWIVHGLPGYENSFLAELIMKDWYHWLISKEIPAMTTPQEFTQLRILNIMNTELITPYISQKYRLKSNSSSLLQEEEYQNIMEQLLRLLQDEKEDTKIHKAVMTNMLAIFEFKGKWQIVNQKQNSRHSVLLKLLQSPDQETRLLAISTLPLMGDTDSLQALVQEAGNPRQSLVEKIALLYGIFNGTSQSNNAHIHQLLFKITDPNTLGWMFALLCHLRYYMEDGMPDMQVRSFFISYINAKIMEYLNGQSHHLLFWTLLSITSMDEFSQAIYNKILYKFQNGQFDSPMLEVLALGVLIHLAMKHNLDDYQKWVNLGYKKLKEPRFRPYLSILVWSYLQTMRNNQINFQLHGKVLGREDEIAVQDLHWLRYQKNLLDPQLCHYAEICLSGSLALLEQFTDNLTILEQEQLQQVELMLSEVYYRNGRTEQGNQILEKNGQHKKHISLAMQWAEHNPQRIHEIWSVWNEKSKQTAQDTTQASIHQAAMLMRMTAIKHSQEKHNEMVIQDLTEAALLEPRTAQSWVLLADAMMADQQYENAEKIIYEAHHFGFYQARTYWAWIRYCAQCYPPATKYNDICYLLTNAGKNWEYPMTLEMLKNLNCPGIPSGELCYRLAYNHASGRWHYEACYWLKEAAKLNYKLNSQEIDSGFPIFKKYKTQKYKALDVQPAIKQLFESK